MGSLMNGRGLSSDWNRHGLRQHTARPSGGITQQRIDFCMQQEWVVKPDDILWRRTKCGLHMDATERERAAAFIRAKAKV